MFPIPESTKQKMLTWLPHVLAKYDYLVMETDNVAPDLEVPSITFYFSSVGTPSYYSNSIVRTVRNAEGGLDDYWGQYHYATMNVVLKANNQAELARMWESFIRKCLATRRVLLLRRDGVRFVEILDSKQLDPEEMPAGKELYWAQVDLRFEYEVSDISDAEYIKRANIQAEVDGSEICYAREVFTKEIDFGILARIR